MFCPNCGTENKETAAFCLNCGMSFDSLTSPVAVGTETPKAKRLLRRVATIVGLGLLCILLGMAGLWAYRRFTSLGERIAYLKKEENGKVGLWVINADGTNPVQIFRDAEEIQFPYNPYRHISTPFSPDNRALLFTVKQDGKYRLYRVNVSGSDLVALTNPRAAASGVFSPDGEQLLIVTQSEKGGKRDLFLADRSGRNQVELAADADNVWAWFSHNSKRLLIRELDAGKTDLFSLRVADKSRNTLVEQATDASASFSNSGEPVLLWVKDRDNPSGALYITDAEGETRERILEGADQISATFLPGDKRIAVSLNRAGRHSFGLLSADGSFLAEVVAGAQDLLYQPFRDGRWVLIAVQQSGKWDVYTVDANGRILAQLASNIDDWPDYRLSPNGRWVAFEEKADGKLRRYLVTIDGSQQVTLFEGADSTWNLAFSPDGAKIVYDVEREGETTICIADSDGTNRKKLVEGGHHPAWSN